MVKCGYCMANLTSSSIDDQQERHFIGDLLCEEDVFAQSNPTRIEGPPSSNSRLGTGAGGGVGVLPGSGPLGPTPNQTFWPEPPPPYSPYTVGPPQWTSMNHQPPPGMLAPPVATLYGQSPTATAVTRTDFYQAPFNGPGEWDHVTGAPMDAYVQGISYAQHPGMPPMMKPMLRSRGSVTNTAVQHHYHNMYQQYHQTLLTAPPNVLPPPPPHIQPPHIHQPPHSQPPVPMPHAPQAMPLGNGYTPIEQPLHVNITRPVQRQNTMKQQQNTQMQYGESVATMPPQAVSGGVNICPPPGKSYRDVASKQQRPSPLNNSGTTAPVRHTSSSSSSGTPQLSTRKITWSQRTVNERHSSGESVPEAVQNGNGAIETSGKILPPYGTSTENTKSSNVNGRRVTENDFQKITHKKSKGCKVGTKNDQLITTDPDGMAGNQALDASSRFDVLQSLGGSPTGAALTNSHGTTTAPRRSRSSGVTQRETSKSRKPNFAPCTQRDGPTRLTKEPVVLAPEQPTESVTTDPQDDAGTKVNAVTQRSVAKKLMVGARRELNEPNTVEPQQQQRVATTRKQRVAARKRRNTTLDYINYVLLVILSLLKRGAEWIADLVIDISLQLRDITVYATLAAYTNVTLSCQRSWYASWERLRLFWDNLCSFSPSKLWNGDDNTSGEWGLSDNIQLPVTGEEAMERLLRCHGQNAYVVLGLRADCAEDDIKRYYKRQAVLVHPDKNHLNGADEAFKILSRAFDAIGSPEARQKYNLANLHKNPLHNEMEELWERLREKMNEARNTMHCDCGSKHARVQVEGVRACEARYCKKCRVRHPAKHNDIWAETRCGGFWWVYYACLDGGVYDITQWATCPNNRLKHMKANSHAVQYRLISTISPSGGKADTSSKQNKRSHHQHHQQQQQQQELDELDYMNGDSFGGGNMELGCGCAMACGETSQLASYRPPDRRALDGDRPRRAGRRRKLR